MADYYPLLNRAIAGLVDRPDSDRHAIYGRARDALERQLRGFEPALEEEAIRLELDALEATIARIEAERVPAATPEPPPPAPSITGPSPYKAIRPTVDDLPPKAEMTDDPSYTPPGAVKPDMAAAPPQPDPASMELPEPPEPEVEPAGEAVPSPLTASTVIDPPGEPANDIAEEPPAVPPMLRPRMPSRRDGDTDRRKKPLALFAGIAIAAMMVMGLIAMTHKNKPDRPAGPPVVTAPDSTPDASKTEGRLAGSDAPARPPEAKDVAQAPASPDATKTATPVQEQRPPAQPPSAVSNSNRAFMVLEVAGSAPNQFEGKTTWTYAQDPALKGQKSLRAAIEFPTGSLAVDFSIAANTDAGINASHTVMVIFDAKNLDNVREMSAVEWRERESQMGTVLAGIVVPVQDNVFMIGLDKTEAALKRNLDLLRSQKWMVFEFRLANGRRGAILVEKGASGEKAIGDALADWK